MQASVPPPPEPNMSVQPPPPAADGPGLLDPRVTQMHERANLEDAANEQAFNNQVNSQLESLIARQRQVDNAAEARKISNSFEADNILQHFANEPAPAEPPVETAPAEKPRMTREQRRAAWAKFLPHREDGGPLDHARDWISDQLGRAYPTEPPDMSQVRAPDEPRKAQTAGAKTNMNVRGKREDGGPVQSEDEEKARLYQKWLETKKREETTGAKPAPSPTLGKYTPAPVAAAMRGAVAGAREDGGAMSAVAHHVTRAVHHAAEAVSSATAPAQSGESETVAPVQHTAPRAAETKGAQAIAHTGVGYQSQPQPTTATLVRPGPVEVPAKSARACGGEIKSMWREVAKRGR